MTENTNLMLKTIASNRKKGYIFVNADGDKLSMARFKDRINHYAKLLGIQKDVKYYDTRRGEVHPRHLVTCMALREAGEKHHDNAGSFPGNYLLWQRDIRCRSRKSIMKRFERTLKHP